MGIIMMPNILDLHIKAGLIAKEIEKQLDFYRLEKKKLSLIEDCLVQNREQLRALNETIRLQEHAEDFKSVIDERREAEIISFKERLSLAVIKDNY